MSLRMSLLLLVVAVPTAIACSDSVEPGDDGNPVEIELTALSVPIVAASDNSLFTLQALDSTSRELASRSLGGNVKWTTQVPRCPTGLDCVLAVDAASNLYMNTADGL